jgi:hypothetical protein
VSYIFNTKPNSYFQGCDLRCERTDTHDVVLLNVKDDMWAVNVKDDLVFSQYPADVRAAANVLPEGIVDGIAERVKNEWWEEADHAADERGFSGVFSAGRSSGWCAVGGTENWDGSDIIEPGEEMREERDKFLALAFLLNDLTEAHDRFFSEVRAAMQQLQSELSEYADWTGADIRSLDGDIAKVTKLEIVHGQAALRTESGWFCMAKGATLIRKADGNIPARITADPIMEQVFQIIEARGELTKETIDAFLDADDYHDPPLDLYQDIVASAVNDVESQIEAWNFSARGRGNQHG